MNKKRDGTTEGGITLTEEDKFKLLKNRRRRQIVEHLLEHDGPTTRSELAEMIAANENEIAVAELGSDQRKRVYVSLYQTHLPTLAQTDVIGYDADRGTVAPGPNMHELVPYIQIGDGGSDEGWHSRFLLLSVLAGASFLAIRLGEPGVPWLADLWAVCLVSVLFLGSIGTLPRLAERPTPGVRLDSLDRGLPRAVRGLATRTGADPTSAYPSDSPRSQRGERAGSASRTAEPRGTVTGGNGESVDDAETSSSGASARAGTDRSEAREDGGGVPLRRT